MKIPCRNCQYTGTPEMKLGGLICGRCRIILYYPNSTEYNLAWSHGSENLLKILNSKLYWIVKHDIC